VSVGTGRTTIVYRDITVADIPSVDELQCQLFPVRYSESFYQRLFTPGHYTVLACSQSGRIIGIASARTVADEIVGTGSGETREGYIMTLGTHEAFRRLGVGSELLRRIMATLRSISCTVAALHVKSLNVAACRFYERHSFRPDPNGGWYPGHYLIGGVQYDAYRLICPLSTSWVSWLATKLGLGAEGTAREEVSHTWPVQEVSSSLPPRHAQLGARDGSGGQGRPLVLAAGSAPVPGVHAGFLCSNLRAPWQ
jgi:ribosomal protein S18 acetylase RimI-like enzyme